jgi:hypothetical protein
MCTSISDVTAVLPVGDALTSSTRMPLTSCCPLIRDEASPDLRGGISLNRGESSMGRPCMQRGSGATALISWYGAPWYLVVAAAIAAVASIVGALAVAAVQTVFPQESAHRLDWWRDRRAQQERQR